MERYDTSYSWGDPDVLSEILRQFSKMRLHVVDVASGPNVIVPQTLIKRKAPFTYVAIDTDTHHLRVQCRGIKNEYCWSVRATGSRLPLKSASIDLFFFHHAIDDILETEGMGGVESALNESLRVTPPGGVIAFSHRVFEYDEFTKKISLGDIETLLAGIGSFDKKRCHGGQQDWLIVTV